MHPLTPASGSAASGLLGAHRRIQEEVERLAGEPGDLVRRAVLLHAVYEESGGGLTFAEMVAHGSLWLASLLALRPERAARFLGPFLERLQQANRAIFVDTLTFWTFTRAHGDDPRAALVVPTPLLASLRTLHAAAREGRPLSEEEKARAFDRCFEREQRLVDPLVRQAFAALGSPVLAALARRPRVRLAFMPPRRRVRYRDFADLEERLRNGRLIYRMAREAGWERVTATLAGYAAAPADLDARARDWRGRLAGLSRPRRCLGSRATADQIRKREERSRYARAIPTPKPAARLVARVTPSMVRTTSRSSRSRTSWTMRASWTPAKQRSAPNTPNGSSISSRMAVPPNRSAPAAKRAPIIRFDPAVRAPKR